MINNSKHLTKIANLKFKRIDYLDLEISKDKYKIPTESSEIICRIDKNVEHRLHSTNAHLNGITDLVISLGNHLEIEKETITKQIDLITGSIAETSRFKKFITENLDFIKNQNEYIITELNKVKINKQPVEDSQDISCLTKALENLKIDNNYKISTKPVKYNHWLPRK